MRRTARIGRTTTAWRLAAVAFVLLTAGVARAETVGDLFQRGNAAYWEGEYGAARDLYHRIVEDFRVENAEVYFNLGNAYAKQGRLGSAMLYYRRALGAAPSDDTRAAIEANLERTRRALVARHRQEIVANRTLFDESHGAWYALFHVLSANALAIVVLATFLPLMGLLILRRLTSRARLRRTLKPAIAALLVLSVASGGLLAGNAATRSTVRLGIVVREDAQLRASRAPNAPTVALPEGLEVRVLNEADEDSLRIQLSNGREGLVSIDAVKEF